MFYVSANKNKKNCVVLLINQNEIEKIINFGECAMCFTGFEMIVLRSQNTYLKRKRREKYNN